MYLRVIKITNPTMFKSNPMGCKHNTHCRDIYHYFPLFSWCRNLRYGTMGNMRYVNKIFDNVIMMTSSNGNISCITDPLMFSLICAWTNGWVNNRDAGDLDVIALIMTSLEWCVSFYSKSFLRWFDTRPLETKGHLTLRAVCMIKKNIHED